MKNTIASLFATLKDEWEKTILLAMLLICLGGLTGGFKKLTDLFRKQTNRPDPRVQVDSAFSDGAFAFLSPRENNKYLRNHIFQVQPPRGWRRRQPKRPPVKPPIVVPNPPTPPPPPSPPPPPPPVPIRHFLVYNGFYSREGGAQMAYIAEENIQGNNKLRSNVHILDVGGKVGKYEVVTFDADMVMLKDPDGRNIELFSGDRFQHAITQNPTAEMLRDLGASTRKRKTPKGQPQSRQRSNQTSGKNTRAKRSAQKLQSDKRSNAKSNAKKTAKSNTKKTANRKRGGVTIDDLKRFGITNRTLKEQGIDPAKVKQGDFTIDDLRRLQKQLQGK